MTSDSPVPDAGRQLQSIRTQIVDQRAALQADLDDVVAASALTSTDDEHDPEGSTIAFERARLIALIAAADDRLAALDAAIARFRGEGSTGGAYGDCEQCGLPIAVERLAARPDTTLCVQCAAQATRRR